MIEMFFYDIDIFVGIYLFCCRTIGQVCPAKEV